MSLVCIYITNNSYDNIIFTRKFVFVTSREQWSAFLQLVLTESCLPCLPDNLWTFLEVLGPCWCWKWSFTTSASTYSVADTTMGTISGYWSYT